jgi:hypothetical protein
MITKSEAVHLPRSSEHMARIELSYPVTIGCYDLDAEVSDSHDTLRYRFLSSLVVVT